MPKYMMLESSSYFISTSCSKYNDAYTHMYNEYTSSFPSHFSKFHNSIFIGNKTKQEHTTLVIKPQTLSMDHMAAKNLQYR